MREATRFSGRLSVAVAAVAVLAVGLGAGNLATPLGVLGALALGWGAGALATDANGRRALGSVATVVGGLLVLVGIVGDPGGGAAVVASTLGLLGLATVAVDATVGLGDDALSPVLAALGSSIAAAIGGVALASVLHVAVTMGLALLVVALLGSVALSTALGAFVALQLQALLAGVLMRRARRTVEGWFPDGVPVDAWEDFEPLALDLGAVPRGYWVALGLQVLLLAVPGVVGLVDWLLAATWVFGATVDAVLRSGVLHAALLAVVALELVVLTAELVRSAAFTALSPNPPRSLSYAAGGLVLVGALPVVVAAAGVLEWTTGVGGSLLVFGGTWGSTAALLSLAVVALGVVFAVEVAGVAVAERSVLPDRAAGVALGATLLFGAAVVAAATPAPEVATFVGVAAALVAWDLGETAADIGSHLGRETATRRAEVVHATGTLAIGAAGVVLALGSVHLIGPLWVPGTSGRAAAALGLSLVALLAFAAAIDRRPNAG